MLAAVVVVLSAMAGPDERTLADGIASALRARGIDAEVAEPPPSLDLQNRIARLETAFATMDVDSAVRLADALVRDAEGPPGADLSAEDLASVFARRAIVARLASDPEGERVAVERLCATGEASPLSEAEHPRWLRENVTETCARRAAAPRADLRVASAADGAAVRVDGHPSGAAPARVSVPPGLHVVHVTAPGVRPFATAVEVTEAGASVTAPAEPDPSAGADAALRAGFSHRVVLRAEGGGFHVVVEDSTQVDTAPVLELQRTGTDLDAATIDSVAGAIVPAPPEPPRRQPRRAVPPPEGGGVPTWVWIAAGVAAVAAGGVGIALASGGEDTWRMEIPVR